MIKPKNDGSDEKIGVGGRVANRRRQKNFTQARLSALSGVPLSTLKNIERGATKEPHPPTLDLLAQTLDIDPGWLRTGDGLPIRKV